MGLIKDDGFIETKVAYLVYFCSCHNKIYSSSISNICPEAHVYHIYVYYM